MSDSYNLNVHVQLSSEVRSLVVGLIIHLLPNCVYANNEGSGGAARMRKLD